MAGRPTKVEQQTWVTTARNALVEDGVPGLKIDRLAQRLGVTRGGFYHNFKDREVLFDALLGYWLERCRFTPPLPTDGSARAAADWFEEFSHDLIAGTGHDHAFDLAVREWSRAEPRVAEAVAASDSERIGVLKQVFGQLGYNAAEATIRARVFYYHQIGYYLIDVRETAAERRSKAPIYLDILCGADRLDTARRSKAA